MHISVACPRCQTRYQVEPSLRGKFMRCPNHMCRAVFEVRDGEPEAAKPPEPMKKEDLPRPISGTVGEIVPMLSAEAVSREAPAEPPLRRESERKPVTAPEAAATDSLRDLEEVLAGAAEASATVETGRWEAPPVRSAGAEGFAVEIPRASRRQRTDTLPTGAARRRRMRRVIFLLFGFLIATISGGLFLSRGRQASHEAEYVGKAEKLYYDREFADAGMLFQKLHREFPESLDAKRYRFLAEFSDVREAVYYPPSDPEETAKTHDRLLQFLAVYQNDPLLEKYKSDIEHSLLRMGKELVALAGQKQERLLLQRAKQSLEDAARFRTRSGPALDLEREIETALPHVEKSIIAQEKRRTLMEAVRRLAGQPSSASVRTARSLVKEARLQTDPEITKLLQGLVAQHAAQVTYTAAFKPAFKPPFGQAGAADTFAAVPLGRIQTAPVKNSEVVLGLARGVLYGLDPRTGRLQWANRIGADTTRLPLRLPATSISPSCFLVVSADQKTLTAIEAKSGSPIWRQQFDDVPAGQPILVGRHVFIATTSGRVLEIESTEGALLGYFTVGQPLTAGGAHQPGTSLLYFPGDSFTIYVLDAVHRKCAGLLYSGHEAGSLRSEPLTILDPDPAPNKNGTSSPAAWLVLTEVQGGDTKLRVFPLPVQHPDEAPLGLDLKVKGWSWSGPYYDYERLALATDAGHFALWGIRQRANRDPELFPLLKSDWALGKAGQSGAALVAHAGTNDFWLLAGERLNRLQVKLARDRGPTIVSPWRDAPEVGNPVHDAEARANDVGGTTLYVTGQSSDTPSCIISAVDAETGKVYWQRQLGLVCLAEPVVVDDRVWMLDPQSVFLIRRGSARPEPVLQVSSDDKVYLLKNDKAKSVIAYVENGKKLVGQLVQLASGASGAGAKKSFTLPAVGAGSPAMGKDSVVMPMADGILMRLPLAEGLPAQGPPWRGTGVDDRQMGHVVALGGADFAVTDGGDGLQIIHWPEPKVWQKKVAVQLPRRIVSAPAVLGSDATVRIAVADTADTVTLLGAERLNIIRQWSLGAKITQGPFARSGNLGCVVGRNRLVWLDPESDKAKWEYAFVAPIAGEPQLIEGFLIVADMAGNVVALNPASGEAGPAYALGSSVAPAASPVAFGKGRLFMPLTDGTLLTLPLSDVTEGASTSSGRKETP